MISFNSPRPQFGPGELVHHRRYGYRGVVVDWDPYCTASDNWYLSNKSQPDRNQPWYHVLVHQSEIVTYAAQTSLEPDESGEPVEHPWVDLFFEEFAGDAYIRNDRPWPQ